MRAFAKEFLNLLIGSIPVRSRAMRVVPIDALGHRSRKQARASRTHFLIEVEEFLRVAEGEDLRGAPIVTDVGTAREKREFKTLGFIQ